MTTDKDFFENCFTNANNVLSPAKLVPVFMNLFNMTVFKTKIEVNQAKLMFSPSSK